MKLGDYFDFLDEDDIRIKGTGMKIETIMDDYPEGLNAEEIAVKYHHLSLEQIYATIAYCLIKRSSRD